MCEETIKLLPRKHKMIFCQIKKAFESRHYAWSNIGLMSIIDNLLSELLCNKGCVNRKGLLVPIIEFYSDRYAIKDIPFIFYLHMLSNNIDMIFSDYNFNEKIVLDTNKKTRRHLSVHGFSYSNKRSDLIMIFNTLMALLHNQEYLIPFEGQLARDRKKKEFYIQGKTYVIENRIKKQLQIECDRE